MKAFQDFTKRFSGSTRIRVFFNLHYALNQRVLHASPVQAGLDNEGIRHLRLSFPFGGF